MAGAEAYGVLRALRLILAALALGVFAVGAPSVFLLVRNRPLVGGDHPLGLVAVLVLVCVSALPATVCNSRGLRNGLRSPARLRPDGIIRAPLLRGFLGLRVMPGAFTEGPTLLGIVVVDLLTGHWLGLCVGALGFVGLLLRVPRASTLCRFVRELTGRIPDVRRGSTPVPLPRVIADVGRIPDVCRGNTP